MMSTSGQRLNGLVLEITDDVVKMDFNHPLAGENLFFKGQITEVREATDDELAALVSGGCGCGSGGGCGSGDCGCDDEEGCAEGACSTEGKQGGCGCGC